MLNGQNITLKYINSRTEIELSKALKLSISCNIHLRAKLVMLIMFMQFESEVELYNNVEFYEEYIRTLLY